MKEAVEVNKSLRSSVRSDLERRKKDFASCEMFPYAHVLSGGILVCNDLKAYATLPAPESAFNDTARHGWDYRVRPMALGPVGLCLNSLLLWQNSKKTCGCLEIKKVSL